jgi:hypothetical protein
MESKVKTRYQKIYDSLYRKLLKGKLRPGDRFISENEICEKYRTSRMTAVRVLNMLEQDRFIVRQQGKGSFVSVDPAGPAGPGDTVAFVMPTMKYLHPLVERLNILYARSQINLKLIIQESGVEAHFADTAYKRVIYKPSWKQETLETDLTPYADRLVVIARKVEDFPGYNIYPNEADMGRKLVLHLMEQGCRHIGYFCTFDEQLHFRLRLKGMKEEAARQGVEVHPLFTRPDLHAVTRVKEWVEQHGIDGVTVGQPQEGLLLYNTLKAIGCGVPDRIKLASFADDGTVNAVGFALPFLDRPYIQLAALIHEVTTTVTDKNKEIVIDTPLSHNQSHEKTADYLPVD